jgi:hypothetical protein
MVLVNMTVLGLFTIVLVEEVMIIIIILLLLLLLLFSLALGPPWALASFSVL